jgi:hypothetical protein
MSLEQIAFKTPAPASTAQVDCACAYARRQAMPTHGLQSIFKSKMLYYSPYRMPADNLSTTYQFDRLLFTWATSWRMHTDKFESE